MEYIEKILTNYTSTYFYQYNIMLMLKNKILTILQLKIKNKK